MLSHGFINALRGNQATNISPILQVESVVSNNLLVLTDGESTIDALITDGNKVDVSKNARIKITKFRTTRFKRLLSMHLIEYGKSNEVVLPLSAIIKPMECASTQTAPVDEVLIKPLLPPIQTEGKHLCRQGHFFLNRITQYFRVFFANRLAASKQPFCDEMAINSTEAITGIPSKTIKKCCTNEIETVLPPCENRINEIYKRPEKRFKKEEI